MWVHTLNVQCCFLLDKESCIQRQGAGGGGLRHVRDNGGNVQVLQKTLKDRAVCRVLGVCQMLERLVQSLSGRNNCAITFTQGSDMVTRGVDRGAGVVEQGPTGYGVLMALVCLWDGPEGKRTTANSPSLNKVQDLNQMLQNRWCSLTIPQWKRLSVGFQTSLRVLDFRIY
ncbi:hypothetical protein Q5P01_018626 [Channa striata]|uniref:Uncharacterized protein n=1 Tax=Channa striata TaxID=64152 RepID=A0AA88M4T5_CHASR|nr:hypothetical protein Q5P01_018626 [Channa striata]